MSRSLVNGAAGGVAPLGLYVWHVASRRRRRRTTGTHSTRTAPSADTASGSLLHAHQPASHTCCHSPSCQAGAGVRWLRVLRVADPGSKAARRRRVHAWIVARNASGAGRCGGGRARAVGLRPTRANSAHRRWWRPGERTEACMRRARSRPCRSARRSMTRSCGDALNAPREMVAKCSGRMSRTV